jgi:predicted nucleic acid-binding protein
MLRVFFDTSVLVAALVGPHPHHGRALPWLEAHGIKVEAMTSQHALLELWSVLTRLPTAPPLAPALAERMVERLAAKVEVLAASPTLHRQAIHRTAERSLRSGAVFDALHLLTAEGARASAVLTFNTQDFIRLAVEGGPRILLPPDPPRVELD